MLWAQFVGTFQALIFAFAQACGGNVAGGILGATLCIRLALLPLTLRSARAAAVVREKMQKLKPELDRLKNRHADDRVRLLQEQQALLQRHGVSMFSPRGCVGAILQMPVVLALFFAVRQCAAAGGRFFWIRNIARPSFVLTLVVTGLTYLSFKYAPGPDEAQRSIMTTLATIFTFAVLLATSAGVALYWAASNLIGLLQNLLLRRERAAA